MFLACAACATEVVFNFAPFLPVWGLCCLIWLCGRSQAGAKPSPWMFVVIGGLAAMVAVSPLSVLVLALALLAWPLWLGASAMRRVDSRAWLACLVLVVPAALWIWNTPQMLVQRLGSGRMAEDASYEIMRRASAGENMMPYLLAGLQGDGHYWIQSSASERQANILTMLPAFHDRSLIPAVSAVLARGDVFTTAPAIACLETLGGQEAANAILERAASHPHDSERAVIALRHLTGQNFGEDWPRWRAWMQAHPLAGPASR